MDFSHIFLFLYAATAGVLLLLLQPDLKIEAMEELNSPLLEKFDVLMFTGLLKIKNPPPSLLPSSRAEGKRAEKG